MQKQKKEVKKEYWRYSKEELYKEFGVSDDGLPEHEIKKRQEQYGLNEFGKRDISAITIFLRQFKSPLIILLLVIIIVSAVISQYMDALILIFMILISSLLGFYNEYNSEKIMRDLSRKVSYKTTVIRAGKRHEIDFKEAVPGDIVLLSLGDVVPADIRLIEAKDLEINESSVSGESVPIHKLALPINKGNLSFSDLKNYLFAGSSITNGQCKGIVLSTGYNTEFGKITQKLTMAHPETEFQKGIRKFGGMLVKVIIILTIIIFFINAVLKKDYLNSLLFALAVAVGLTPEFLPLVITVSLANGAKKLFKKEMLVKRLVTIEDLGNIEILCSDKTGTLTEGKITLTNYFDTEKKINERVFLYSLLCNAVITEKKKVHGRPIDVAIVEHAKMTNRMDTQGYEKTFELPFDYDRKRVSVVINKGKETLLISKGSPESILKIATHILKGNKMLPISSHLKTIREEFNRLAKDGYIAIAVGYRPIKVSKEYSIGDEKDIILAGYVTFFDPPKKSAKESLLKLKELGVDTKILTGDNEIITKKVCDELSIPIRRIVLGNELDDMDDEKLKEIVLEVDIFAKLTPMQKVRIINLLREKGKVVGYIGDGVNDAAALHEADVGISVDSAVEVAKNSADILLLRKSLGVIHDGILEGRKVFGNTIKYIFMETSSNFGNMLSVAGASFFLPFLPLLPIQILLNNLLYDVSQLTLSTDNVDAEYLKKPKRWNIKMIKEYMLWFGPISSVYDFLTFGLMIFVFSSSVELFRTGWFIESLFTQTLVVFVIRTKRIPFFKSRPSTPLMVSCALVLLAGLIIPFSPLHKFLGFVHTPLLFFIFLIIMVVTYMAAVEFFKSLFFKRYDL